MMNLRNTLPIVWQDVDDKLIKVDASRVLVRILRAKKCDVVFDETRGVGHVPTKKILEDCYSTLRGKPRVLYPSRVTIQSDRPDAIFNRADWVQMDQPLEIGKERRMIFSRGSGAMIRYDKTFMVDAILDENNRIEVVTDNVRGVRFYLNDQMIDFARPLTVIVDRRNRFDAVITPRISEMLNDQLFIGRGWRYFTAVVDIDLARASPTTRAAARPTPTTRPRS